MATPNYGYEKRQRELAKKRKKEEKALRKAQGGSAQPEGEQAPEADGDPPASEPGTEPGATPAR